LPGGGGIRSSHVGFSRITSGNAMPALINAITVIQRRRDSAAGRRQPYHAISAMAGAANTAHNADETSGSNVRVRMLAVVRH
jgi:hypothetical protein